MKAKKESPIKQKLRSVGLSNFNNVGMEVRYLEKVLYADEEILGAVQGMYSTYWSLLVLTDKRIFVLDRRVSGTTEVSYDFEKINDITYKTGFFFGKIFLLTSSSGILVEFIEKKAILPFVRKVQEQMDLHRNMPQPVIIQNEQSEGTASTLQQMQELKQMLDMQLITQEEFEAKKKKLLDL